MKLSIIIPILDSPEAFRRQMLYFEKVGIPDDTDILIMDDGSKVPLKYDGSLPVTIHYTNDQRPWTSSLARNNAVKMVDSEYLLMYDCDHIATRELIDAVRTFGGDRMQFVREFAILNEEGDLVQDISTLVEYGLPKKRIMRKGLKIMPHPNMYAIKRSVFLELGGYNEHYILNRRYPQGEDSLFKKTWCIYEREGKGITYHERPTLYMYPNGYFCGDVDYDKFGLFHKLSRKTRRNRRYQKQRIG